MVGCRADGRFEGILDADHFTVSNELKDNPPEDPGRKNQLAALGASLSIESGADMIICTLTTHDFDLAP